MTLFDVVVLGIVEGITEFLPISSTGHMVLTTTLLKIPDTDFVKTFIIVVQLGAILAAAVLYWRRLLLDRRTLVITMLAFVPTGLFGFVLYKAVKSFLGNPAIVVASLLVGGVLLIAIEWWLTRRRARAEGLGARGEDTPAPRSGDRMVGTLEARGVSDITYGQAVVIGTCQALSMVPGVSRSAATIMTGLILGIDRAAIVEFSFILAIPTMAMASTYEIYKSHAAMSFEQIDQLIVGFVVAFVLALVAIKWLIRFVQTHTFNAFGVYRIVAAILFWLVVLR